MHITSSLLGSQRKLPWRSAFELKVEEEKLTEKKWGISVPTRAKALGHEGTWPMQQVKRGLCGQGVVRGNANRIRLERWVSPDGMEA